MSVNFSADGRLLLDRAGPSVSLGTSLNWDRETFSSDGFRTTLRWRRKLTVSSTCRLIFFEYSELFSNFRWYSRFFM